MKSKDVILKQMGILEKDIENLVTFSDKTQIAEKKRRFHLAGVSDTARRTLGWVLEDGDEELVL